jgi:hypothetical protein
MRSRAEVAGPDISSSPDVGRGLQSCHTLRVYAFKRLSCWLKNFPRLSALYRLLPMRLSLFAALWGLFTVLIASTMGRNAVELE